MIRLTPLGPGGLVLYGVVRGLVSEAEALVAALETAPPPLLAVGLSEEELASLAEHFVEVETEPLVPLLPTEAVEVRALAAYGEVRLPQPAYRAALEWARDRGVESVAVDATEEEYASAFSEEVGYWELVRRTVRERGLSRSPPKAPDAGAFVLAWDARLNGGRGSRRLVRARNEALARRLAPHLRRAPRLSLVVDRERAEGLAEALRSGVPA